MICGEGTAIIRRPAADILEFVLDLPRYARADTKIRRIRSVARDGNVGAVRHGGQLRGLPGPPVTLAFRLEPYTSLTFTSVKRGLGRYLFSFEGTFECEETDEGTRVVHRECFRFRPPLAWPLERFLGRWLANDTREEMTRMKAILEA